MRINPRHKRIKAIEIEKSAAELGLSLDLYSPGDGCTRYTFTLKGHVIGRCLGSYEANIFLTGYAQGLAAK